MLKILKRYTAKLFLSTQIILVICFAALIIIYPQNSFEAAKVGIATWWNIVLPALFPFFVISEILMGLGVVNFIGVILEPIMKPLFNVSGSGAFVVAVGYTSGAPIGAVLTKKIRNLDLCTKIEAERLLAFTNNASPLFMFSAVAVGMFNNQKLGIVIAMVHYLANILVGIIMRFYKYNETKNALPNIFQKKSNILLRAISSLLNAYKNDGRNFGQLLGDAVKNSMYTLFSVGGFIIIFSVIINILSLVGILNILGTFFSTFLAFLKIEPILYNSLAAGIVEMTIGAQKASQTIAPLGEQLLVVSMILGWLGLSVHAQVISIIADTDISFIPYLLARILHSCLAVFLTLVFINQPLLVNVFLNLNNQIQFRTPWLTSLFLLKNTMIILVLICFLICLVNIFTNKLKEHLPK